MIEGEDFGDAECRRYPPNSSNIQTGSESEIFGYPIVHSKHYWCGEFQQSEEKYYGSLLPPKYRNNTNKIVRIIKGHNGDDKSLVQKFKDIGLISKKTYWCDVHFYRNIYDSIHGEFQPKEGKDNET